MTSRRRQLAVVAALAVVAYLGALGAPFIYDDFHGILENPSIRDPGNLRWIFLGSRRFVTAFSYSVDWALWGPRPFGFHLTNLLLHAAVATSLLGLARRLWQNDAPTLFAAALFAVHPLGSESVAYVSSRAGILCALFLIGSTWAWHRALTERRRWLLAAVPLWILAVASKETGLVAPVLWVACDVLFVAGWRRRLVWYLPCAALALAAGAWRLHSYLHLEHGASSSLGLHLLGQAQIFWRYLFLWIVPVGLSLVHEVAPVRFADPAAWLAVISLVMGALLLLRLPRAALFGGVWFLVLLLPSAVVPLMQPMAEHRVYEASVGAALLTAVLATRLKRPLAAALVLLLLLVTLFRVQLWRDPARLWRDAAEKAPGHWRAWSALGDALRDQGDCAAAVEAYGTALARNPNDRRAPRGRGICLALLGRFDEADTQLRRLLEETPLDAALHYNLGLLELSRGRPESARAYLLRALAIDPRTLRPCQALRRLPGELPRVCDGEIR